MSLRSLTFAAGLLAGLVAPAIALAAYTTGSVNVRTGPGTNYYVITTAPPGAWVGVHRCVANWCDVSVVGVRGWMSAAYIGDGPQPYYAPQPRYVPPPYAYRPAPPPPVYYDPYTYRGPYPYYGPRRPRTSYGFSFGFVR